MIFFFFISQIDDDDQFVARAWAFERQLKSWAIKNIKNEIDILFHAFDFKRKSIASYTLSSNEWSEIEKRENHPSFRSSSGFNHVSGLDDNEWLNEIYDKKEDKIVMPLKHINLRGLQTVIIFTRTVHVLSPSSQKVS